MSQVNLNDPKFGIKIIPAEEVINKIPREVLLVKCVDLYRRMTGKEPLLPGDITKMDLEAIKKEFDEIPKGNSEAVLIFGESI
jgi:hypothetical protein